MLKPLGKKFFLIFNIAVGGNWPDAQFINRISSENGGGLCRIFREHCPSLDTSKWFHQTQLPNGNSWYNGEQQHYTDRTENASVENGILDHR